MNIEMIYDGGRVVAKDGEGNEVYYSKKRNELVVLFATFSGVIYDKVPLGWKRTKRGAVSKAFYSWYEQMDKAVYDKHYKQVQEY
ncbi:hypothetical protein FT641_20300 [Bacillus paranthracis]|uniref:hypothetical protein n=1 Tax=Bacillus paranthracis TaxID=2026186 RepID=UPI001879B40B|nr:hypothetical protein [Bacillus paranthracis]MBE7114595.1 hypothetical protein [Bacillus paranthracis]MBE7155038.1 hypothetical protein [Bacillus paranthracis]